MINKQITFTIKGGDYNSWALDQTLYYVARGFREKTNWVYVDSIFLADIVIFGWYPGFLENKLFITSSKILICILDNDSRKIYKDIFKDKNLQKIDIWLTHSTREKNYLRDKGLNSFILPYPKKNKHYKPRIEKKYLSFINSLKLFKAKNNIKLILSSQRDSSIVNKKWLPKKQKNPEYLIELYKESVKQNLPYILVICGVRRHWILKQLEKNILPYIFVGDKPNINDDYLKKLPRDLILEITKLCDFSIVTSSWEGGPLCIFESLEVGKPTFSTDVGFARDLLSNNFILSGKLESDIKIIKNILFSEEKNNLSTNECLVKYENFIQIDLINIIDKIYQLKKTKIYYFKLNLNLYKFKFLDNVLNNLENFLKRSFNFLKRNLRK